MFKRLFLRNGVLQKIKAVAPLEGKLHLVKVGNCHRIFTDSIGLLVTLVSSVSEASAVWDEPDLKLHNAMLRKHSVICYE